MAIFQILTKFVCTQVFTSFRKHSMTQDGVQYLVTDLWFYSMFIDILACHFYVLIPLVCTFLRFRELYDQKYRNKDPYAFQFKAFLVTLIISFVSAVFSRNLKVYVVDNQGKGMFVTVGDENIVEEIIDLACYCLPVLTIICWIGIWKYGRRASVFDGMVLGSVLFCILQLISDATRYPFWTHPMILGFLNFYSKHLDSILCAPLIFLPGYVMWKFV